MIDYPWRKNNICLYLIVSGVPKTTLEPDKLLEGFAELKEAIIFMVIVCCNERIQIKTNEWKRQMDKIQERSGTTCAESIANQGTSFGP